MLVLYIKCHGHQIHHTSSGSNNIITFLYNFFTILYYSSASKDSTIKLWNVKNTKKATYTLPGHEDEVYALDWYYNNYFYTDLN